MYPRSPSTPASRVPVISYTKDRAEIAPSAMIAPHFLDEETSFLDVKVTTPFIRAKQLRDLSMKARHEAIAVLSTCNGTPTILNQHNARANGNDNERTCPVTTLSVPSSQIMRPFFVPLKLACDAFDTSPTNASDGIFNILATTLAFSHWTQWVSIVELVEYNCSEKFAMLSKARLLDDNLALSAMFASDDHREQKCLSR